MYQHPLLLHPDSGSAGVAGLSGQQVLKRRVVQFIDGDDVIQMLQVPLLVSHEVWDSGPLKHSQLPQPLHIFIGHLA